MLSPWLQVHVREGSEKSFHLSAYFLPWFRVVFTVCFTMERLKQFQSSARQIVPLQEKRLLMNCEQMPALT